MTDELIIDTVGDTEGTVVTINVMVEDDAVMHFDGNVFWTEIHDNTEELALLHYVNLEVFLRLVLECQLQSIP